MTRVPPALYDSSGDGRGPGFGAGVIDVAAAKGDAAIAAAGTAVIRVLLLGEIRVGREGLAALLAEDPALHVTTLAPDADDVALESAAADVVVVDARADSDRVRQLAADVDARVVVLGAPADDREVIAFAELGVVGFVEREAALADLLDSIHSAARGEASFPPRIATVLLKRVSVLGARRDAPDATALTVRERQVVQLIAEGLSNKEIAARLCIEIATVKNHVHNILEKLEVSRRTDAVARLGIVDDAGGGGTTVRFPSTRSRPGSRAG